MSNMKVRIGNGDKHEHHEHHEHHENHEPGGTEGHGEPSDSDPGASAPDPASNPTGTQEKPPEDTKPHLVPVQLTSGVIAYGKTTMIKCIDCEKERMIKIQDAFQVKRCPDCQKIFRNKQRSNARKAKRQAANAEKQAAEASTEQSPE